jgi:hypothetical protein
VVRNLSALIAAPQAVFAEPGRSGSKAAGVVEQRPTGSLPGLGRGEGKGSHTVRPPKGLKKSQL